MAKQRDDAQLWLRQAADDHRFGRLALANEFNAQARFIAQQSAEKAVKAVAYHLGMRPVVGHSIHALLKRLNARGRVTEKLLVLGGELDQSGDAHRPPDDALHRGAALDEPRPRPGRRGRYVGQAEPQ